ncbi:DUF305 domain-containing protein [Micromonospora radicis]|uniref:DUF305 domain-containing protein n=1 Tax=Micromonospora radicis TaxID=1894971 RepID=A0A418MXY4_9ACTN|nr:DUF305 domain-containing protein [Micromonospora radicis]
MIVALLAPLLLGACGTPAAPESPSTSGTAVAEIKAAQDYNDTDVMFLQMFVHHQRQGLQMTAAAVGRAQDPELRTLAEAVRATEQDELKMIEGWLRGWGKPTEVDTAPNLHADHGGLPGTGPAEIESLTTVADAEFDTAFLSLFLAHQHNAMELANLVKDGGRNADTMAFGERVRASRQGEIQQMLRLMSK